MVGEQKQERKLNHSFLRPKIFQGESKQKDVGQFFLFLGDANWYAEKIPNEIQFKLKWR